MNYWLVTDTHFGHLRIVTDFGFRPKGFEDLIIKNIQRDVKADDVLIHLGDISFDNDAFWHEQLKSINCARWLVLGNHDKRSAKWYLEHGWHFVAESFILNVFGCKILFSHVPKVDSGYGINIHGHFHDNDPKDFEPEFVSIANEKQVLLAMELNKYKPYNLRTVVEKFNKKVPVHNK